MSPGRSAESPAVAGTGQPRVLFVSHEATRSGAPIMFLHFLRWLRANTSLSFEILLLAGGPLADDFAAVAPTTSIEALGRSSASYFEAGIAKAGFPKAGDRLKVERVQRTVKHLRGFDALYLNSTTSALALRILPEIPPVVFSHIVNSTLSCARVTGASIANGASAAMPARAMARSEFRIEISR